MITVPKTKYQHRYVTMSCFAVPTSAAASIVRSRVLDGIQQPGDLFLEEPVLI